MPLFKVDERDDVTNWGDAAAGEIPMWNERHAGAIFRGFNGPSTSSVHCCMGDGDGWGRPILVIILHV